MDMKKNCFLRLMNVVMMATMCVTSFTACGGDDEDDLPGQDVPGTVTYYEPCFDWGSNTNHVKAYMSGWDLVETSNDYAQMYSNGRNTTTVTYAFLGRNQGLSMVAVNYITGNVNYIISEIERRYSMTLTKDDKNSNKGETAYSGQGVIGGRTITVLLHSTTVSQSVFYKVPD